MSPGSVGAEIIAPEEINLVTVQYTRQQVSLMLQVAAIYDDDLDYKLARIGVESYFGLQADGRGGYTCLLN